MPELLNQNKENILDIGVSTLDSDILIKRIFKSIYNQKKIVIACANPHSIVIANQDEDFLNSLNSFSIILPDGIGIVLASKILGGRIKSRISGPDLFFEITKEANACGNISYFFLGSSQDVLEKIKMRLKKEFPNIEVSGCFSPPFRELTNNENSDIIKIINNSKPTFLWVGMTAPKQEKWICRNLASIDVPVIGAIGAAFDFFSMTKKRPSKYIRTAGFEWFFRFISEPRRLWKRNLISMPKFFYSIILQKIGIKYRNL